MLYSVARRFQVAMYVVAVACVGNIFLDYLFMGCLRMGLVGAAYGTLIAQGISVVLALAYPMQRP